MRLADRLPTGRRWRHLPRRTVRFRLTLLYGSLFLATGAGLLAITYVLVQSSYHVVILGGSLAHAGTGKSVYKIGANGQLQRVAGHGHPTPAQLRLARQLEAQALATHNSDLHQLLIKSGIALAIMAVLAIVFGWVVAGRVLRPLRTMKQTTKQITEHNLHRRLAVEGPDDEIKDLADTIDDLLGRLETAFGAQRRFVANASHELRTPLTLERALVEVALAKPSATSEDLRAALQDVLVSNEQQERLIEALLTLATSERGIDHWDHVDLTALTKRVLVPRRAEATSKGLQIDEDYAPALISGDSDLLERLIANLVDNAICHNVVGGQIEVVTGTFEGRPTLMIANSGPAMGSTEVERFFQPYQRLGRDRLTRAEGHGLGLSIVEAIASAHDAVMEAQPRSGGGMEVQVHFPAHKSAVDEGGRQLLEGIEVATTEDNGKVASSQ